MDGGAVVQVDQVEVGVLQFGDIDGKAGGGVAG